MAEEDMIFFYFQEKYTKTRGKIFFKYFRYHFDQFHPWAKTVISMEMAKGEAEIGRKFRD
ncbi:MAG: hypothetical protein LBI77_02950 [Puniceicoccales bacterium]|jgi:hypothetical protein|nr:hypothetical protein [Puniceicoccales bacterium]